jgi:hypothetical protein
MMQDMGMIRMQPIGNYRYRRMLQDFATAQ